MKTLTALALPAVLLLGACSDRTPANDQATSASTADTAIGRSVKKAMDKARAKLASENISLTSFQVSANGNGLSVMTHSDGDDTRPNAVITPQGDMLIEGKKVPANAEQHALLVQYRKQIEGVASAGMDIGVQGADLGIKAASEAIKGVFSGNTDDIEQRIEAETGKIKLSARKLCDQLPAVLKTQDALAAIMPEFKPYATMEQSDVDSCYDDESTDNGQARSRVQHQVRDAIRSGIRNTVRTVTPNTGSAARPESGQNAAQEAEAASATDSSKR